MAGGGGAAGAIPTIGGITALPIGGALTGLPGGLSGIPGAAGGASSGILGKFAFGGVESLLASGGILGGISLLGKAASSGGPITGAIGGALAGMGAASLFAVGGAFGLPGLAIAGIAAGIGALIGWLGSGRAKRKANKIEQQYEAQSRELIEQYKKFDMDFESALSGMQGVFSEGAQALLSSGTGKWGKRGVGTLQHAIDAQIAEVQSIERERNSRRQTLAGMTIPEFAVGGLIPSLKGGMLAIVHPGEFVMRKSAVDVLGTDFLAGLNRAPRFDAGGQVPGARGQASGRPIELTQTFQIVTPNGPGVVNWLRSHRGQLAKEIRSLVQDGAL